MTSGDSQGGRGPLGSPLAFASLGFEMLAPILLGAWAGYRLDQWRDTRPWFLVAGLLLGILLSLVGFFRRVWPKGNGGNRK